MIKTHTGLRARMPGAYWWGILMLFALIGEARPFIVLICYVIFVWKGIFYPVVFETTEVQNEIKRSKRKRSR